MLDQPQIVQTTRQPTAVIRLKIPRNEIQHVMGPAIGEVMAALAAQGLAPAGAVFSQHFRMHPDTFDFEVGVPVIGPIAPTGRVQAGELPACTVARTIYHGPYEGLGQAWGEFNERLKADGHTAAENLWESYVVGPESGPDPAGWQTQLNRPLA